MDCTVARTEWLNIPAHSRLDGAAKALQEQTGGDHEHAARGHLPHDERRTKPARANGWSHALAAKHHRGAIVTDLEERR